MNEQRTQAYLNLINQLLSCNEGDEPRILQENEELLDQGLIEVMIAVAQQLEEAERENEARWLLNIARQLAQVLGLLDNTTTESANTSQDYLKLLMETLQKSSKFSPQRNPPYFNFLLEILEIITDNITQNNIKTYLDSYFEKNLEKLNPTFCHFFEEWGHSLAELKPEIAQSIALAIGVFCGYIRAFPLGDLSTNIDISIIGYKIILSNCSQNTQSEFWASVQNQLANAYCERINGDKGENFDKAIIAYNAALEVYTRQEYPENWAMLQYNLGTTYSEQIRRDKSENLEKAISAYKNALEVRTREKLPIDYADTQYNLGNAYSERILGTKIDNLEKAIIAYKNALRIKNRKEFLIDWAKIQNNLGRVYLFRQYGSRRENIQKSIAIFEKLLEIYDIEINPKEWASVQKNLSSAYYLLGLYSTLDDKENNLEKSIIGCEAALNIYDYQTEDWAEMQIAIGNAYQVRIRGDKEENLEKSVSAYEAGCEVFLKNQSLKNWAVSQNNLGNTLRKRIKGNKKDNIELAILAYNAALEVLTRQVYPEDWARTQANLGDVYTERIEGNTRENLEKSIAAYNAALEVYTPQAYPENYARIQSDLGGQYIIRLCEDRVDNIEKGIIACESASKIFDRRNYPDKWLKTQYNLGLGYIVRIRGEKEKNLEKAITVFKAILEFSNPHAEPNHQLDPEDWAWTQCNLAIAYRHRVLGEEEENLEKAIAAYTKALEVYTRQEFPQMWTNIQDNLAIVFCDRIRGNKKDNLERAIALHKASLIFYTREHFPMDWALVQNNLGNSYRNQGFTNQAIRAFRLALEIQTPESFPIDCLRTARNLANLHYDQKQWQPATKAYHTAIEAVENARLEALNPQSRQEVLSNAIDVFHRIVQAYLNLNQPEKALEYIERSKGRNLVELMTQKNLHPQGISQEFIDQLNELKQRVVNEQIRLQHQSINQNLMRSNNLTPYVQDHSYLKEYQQELDNFIDREIKPVDPLFSLTRKVEPLPFTDIQALTDAETCLLQWYITREKILAFVVSADGDIKVWQSSEEDKNQLVDVINNYLQLYYSENGKTEWRNQLSSLLQTFADILHINDILALIPDTCKRLIIVPHRGLHILPLHALPVSNSHILKFGAGSNAQDLHDLFPNGVQYAPSCQLLRIAQSFQHFNFNKLFAIQNPTKDLLYTDLEVNILSNFFTESQIIAKDNATKNTIIPHLKPSNNHCHHFSSHGGFNPNNPLESALFLANKEPLTLGEIFELRLNQCRLVTLSACETGLIDLNSISDEYIGLPSGFLFAGSPSVVSSLWTVNDLSTSFLMIKFYEILFNVDLNISVAVALKEAQDWLQNLTIEKLDEFLEQYQPQIDKHLTPLRPGQRKIYQKSLETIRERQPHPFANPYYWAGFIATGI